MRHGVSWPAVLVVVAAVAVTSFSGYLLATWPPEPPEAPGLPAVAATPSVVETTPSPVPSPSRPAHPESEDLTMVVLGDSVTTSSEASAGPEWPTLLGEAFGVEVRVDAAKGSGFVSAGEDRPFGARVQAVLRDSPDVIVVAGGLDDLGAYPTGRIATAADELIGRLSEQAPQAEIVVLSPFSPGEPGPLTRELAAELEQIAASYDATYVDATTWLTNRNSLFGEDPDHPADRGQGRIAERLERALIERGIISAQGSTAD